MRTPLPRVSRRGRLVVALLLGLLVVIILGGWLVSTLADWYWYSEVKYTSVFTVELRTKIELFAVFGLVTALWFGSNLYAAFRLRPRSRPDSPEQQNLDRYRMALTPRIRLWIGILAALAGVIAGLSGQGHWSTWLLFMHAQKFGTRDPQFGTDIGFYVFDYPFYQYLVGVGFTLVFVALIGALFAHWLYGGVRLSGRGDRITNAARLHLSLLVALFVALKAVAYFLDQRGLLLEHNGVTGLDGAGYTGIHALLPAKQILTWIAVVVAVGVLVFSNAVMRNLVWPGVSLALLAIAAVTIGGIYPAMVSSFTVKPNIPDKERSYIARSISATRDAYGIAPAHHHGYSTSGNPSPTVLQQDTTTVPNIRVLDPAKVSETYTQLEQVRGFYSFGAKLNVDRYTVDGTTQDYVVGVRELDSTKLTGSQTQWNQRHTVFTHGYGFVAAPADQVCKGKPEFVAGDLSGQAQSSGDPGCAYSTDQIPVSQPRIYYGNLISDFSVVGGSNKEYDRPSSEAQQSTNTYRGAGGVPVGSMGKRLLYSLYFQDTKFLLASDSFNSKSKLLYVRNPRDRVEKVAPFLTVDGDPYPAVVKGRIVWILDCYTTASSYPYSQRTDLQAATSDSLTGTGTAQQQKEDINYIRNSVKATVDAESGAVNLYAFDKTDPVLKAWNSVFGGIVQPASAISPELAAHFRYPEDLFKVQRDTLTKFHVTNPPSFIGGSDFWSVPKDPASNSDKQPPYYVVAQYPGQPGATFQLTAPLTRSGQDNLAALMSASYDTRGRPRLDVYEFNTNATVLGPNAIKPSMQNQQGVRDQLTLSESTNSQLVYGNLLTLPVGGSLLYVEPVYIKGRQLTWPQLSLVLVAYAGKVGSGADTASAINSLVTQTGNSPPNGSPNPAPSPQSGDLAAAVAKIQQALTDLKNAQKNGDFEGQGKALKELDDATKQFQLAQQKAAAASPAPSASPTPKR